MEHWLNRWVLREPDTPALTVGKTVYSNSDLLRKANTYATYLIETFGAAPGTIIGLFLPNSAQCVFCIHAVSYFGGSVIPLHERITREEAKKTIGDFDIHILITSREQAQYFSSMSITVVTTKELEAAPENGHLNQGEFGFDSIHSIIATSGTTSKPKTVPIAYANLLSSALASTNRIGVKANDVWLSVLPFAHVGGLSILTRSLISGYHVVVLPRFEEKEFLQALREYRATIASLVPTMLYRLLREHSFSHSEYPSLRCILLGGAKADDAMLREAFSRNLPVFPTYGMTETCSQIATAIPEEAQRLPGTVGKPLLHANIAIRDDEGNDLPSLQSGRIWVSGPMVVKGYAEGGSESSFRDGWFRTGDVGWMNNEGYLFIQGRADDVIISGGENIQPAEIEEVLRLHRMVLDAAVIGMEDNEWGQIVVAAVETNIPNVSPIMLADHCRAHLAAYKIPKRWLIVPVLPRSGAGKILKSALRERPISDWERVE